MARLVIVNGAEWNDEDMARGWRPTIEYYSLTHGKSKPRDPAWMLRPGDQIFFKNTEMDNAHPIYISAVNRLGTNPWFSFELEETECDGVKGLMLTCVSSIKTTLKTLKADRAIGVGEA